MHQYIITYHQILTHMHISAHPSTNKHTLTQAEPILSILPALTRHYPSKVPALSKCWDLVYAPSFDIHTCVPIEETPENQQVRERIMPEPSYTFLQQIPGNNRHLSANSASNCLIQLLLTKPPLDSDIKTCRSVDSICLFCNLLLKICVIVTCHVMQINLLYHIITWLQCYEVISEVISEVKVLNVTRQNCLILWHAYT